MTKTLVNLTTPVVLAEIEEVLSNYPDYPYHKVFANPDMRQELVAYVLTRVQSIYSTCDADQSEEQQSFTNGRICSVQAEESIPMLIHEGILELLKEFSDPAQIPEECDAGLAPSHWFG
ncbi:hypothetical protein ACN4EG_17855 [Alkalinema pantanalense CENA528]|uniref:hypothetical protein n=1 Tax=Alkalinema pantanalense TaxID=1620705 RepID=UPI003D6E4819